MVRLAAAFVAVGSMLDLFGPPLVRLRPHVDRLHLFAVVTAAAFWFAASYAIITLQLAPVFVRDLTAWAIVFVLVPVFAVSVSVHVVM